MALITYVTFHLLHVFLVYCHAQMVFASRQSTASDSNPPSLQSFVCSWWVMLICAFSSATLVHPLILFDQQVLSANQCAHLCPPDLSRLYPVGSTCCTSACPRPNRTQSRNRRTSRQSSIRRPLSNMTLPGSTWPSSLGDGVDFSNPFLSSLPISHEVT